MRADIFISRDLPPLRCWNTIEVQRLRVYWYFYLRNIAVMEKKYSSYQVEFNFIYDMFVLIF